MTNAGPAMMTFPSPAEQQEEYVPCIGIDLGTSNSCVALYREDGEIEVVANEEGKRTTPSCVAFLSQDFFLVGEYAQIICERGGRNAIRNVKRMIGRAFQDAQIDQLCQQLSYVVEEDEEGRPLIKVEDLAENQTDNQIAQFYPEEISACILEKMKSFAALKI